MNNNNHHRTAHERLQWLQSVIQMTPNHDSCQQVTEQLDDYIAAQIAGDNYMFRFASVATHLDACLACAGAYFRLYELAVAEATDRLPLPIAIPEPNLDFLHGTSEHPRASKAENAPDLSHIIQAALSRTAETIRLQLSDLLVELLRPAPLPATVRAPVSAERYHEILLHIDTSQHPEASRAPKDDLCFTLTAYRDGQQPTQCLVEVVVAPPGLSWPHLVGWSVALTIGTSRQVQMTDAWGMASFDTVAVDDLPQLQVEVGRPQE